MALSESEIPEDTAMDLTSDTDAILLSEIVTQESSQSVLPLQNHNVPIKTKRIVKKRNNMRRQYLSCLGKECVVDNDDEHSDGGYRRLQNSENGDLESNCTIGRDDSRRGRTEDDYFRRADSYQWNASDNDGRRETSGVDQGTPNYTGVRVKSDQTEKKLKKKTLIKRIRHFLRVSLKWMRRGVVMVSPAITPHVIMNPAVVMARGPTIKSIHSSKSPMVFL